MSINLSFIGDTYILYNFILKCIIFIFSADTIEPDIDDVKMAFRDKDVAVPDLIRYLKQVGSIEFPHQVPKFPIPTKSNLNIMKPGSREIVTRPVYVHEHLPTMYPEQSGKTFLKIFVFILNS